MQVPLILHVIQNSGCGGEGVEGFPLCLAQAEGGVAVYKISEKRFPEYQDTLRRACRSGGGGSM